MNLDLREWHITQLGTIFIILLPHRKRHFLIVNFHFIPFTVLNPKKLLFIFLSFPPRFPYYYIKVKTNTIYMYTLCCSRTVNHWLIMHHEIYSNHFNWTVHTFSLRQKANETLLCGPGLILHRPKRISSIPLTFSLSEVLVVLGPTSHILYICNMYIANLKFIHDLELKDAS